jgi:hypothetical protein
VERSRDHAAALAEHFADDGEIVRTLRKPVLSRLLDLPPPTSKLVGGQYEVLVRSNFEPLD